MDHYFVAYFVRQRGTYTCCIFLPSMKPSSKQVEITCWIIIMTLSLNRYLVSSFRSNLLCSRKSFRRRNIYFAEPPLEPEAVRSLLRGTLSRAARRLADTNQEEESNQDKGDTQPLANVSITTEAGTRQLLDQTVVRAKRAISTKSTNPEPANKKQEPGPQEKGNRPYQSTDLRYGQNPAISFTALAHWLWATVVRPHEDAVIDATCGNGHDSVGIASLLFPNEDLYLHKDAELICIDIQRQGCEATKNALSKVLNSWTMSNQVQIIEGSHAPLPIPRNPPSLGLVVYNLGYLPNSEKEYLTQVHSTLTSITDALLMIRVGGMVSVMTYPKTDDEEDFAVRALLEASVIMTNKQGPKWYSFVDALDCRPTVKELLGKELRRMSDHYETKGNSRRTFRVAEHKKIGLTQAPILMTATRIK